jgi:hypothetical protein
MAPMIQIPAEDTLKTLQNVLKQRIDANRILKEREEDAQRGRLSTYAGRFEQETILTAAGCQ